MNTQPNIEPPKIAEKFEELLEERKNKKDRRKEPYAPLPADIERRVNKDRRGDN